MQVELVIRTMSVSDDMLKAAERQIDGSLKRYGLELWMDDKGNYSVRPARKRVI